MKEVIVNKQELIGKIKENLANHLSEYKAAHAIWIEDTIADFKAHIKSLKETGKRSENVKNGIEPSSQEKSYERALKMLEMSVEDQIVLSQEEFSQYVMDEWYWTPTFKSVTSTYMNK